MPQGGKFASHQKMIYVSPPRVSILVGTPNRSELLEVLSSFVTTKSSSTTTPTTSVNASMARLRQEDDRIAARRVQYLAIVPT